MGDLTGYHVDFIRLRDRDKHFRICCASLFQDIGMGRKAKYGLNVQIIVYSANSIGVMIDHRHVDFFGGEMARNVKADLSSPANQNSHIDVLCGVRPLCRVMGGSHLGFIIAGYAQRFKFAMKGGTLHSDIIRGFGYVIPKSHDLCLKILFFKQFSRLSQA